MSMISQFDMSVVLSLNALASSGAGYVIVTRLFGTYVIFLPIIFGIVALLTTYPGLRVSGPFLFLQMLLAGAVAWVVNNVISIFWFRDRPYVQNPDAVTPLIDIQLILKSFPSDHSALAMALATIVTLYMPKVGIPFVMLALFIGFARVAAGVHFPTDILGGFIIGAVVGVLVHKFFV